MTPNPNVRAETGAAVAIANSKPKESNSFFIVGKVLKDV
jgi:hypothetical protein